MTTCVVEECDNESIYARGACSACYQQFRSQGRLNELASEIPEKACATCGSTFQPKTMRRDAAYCSRRCIDVARSVRERAGIAARADSRRGECEYCGRVFAGKRADARFCDAKCSHAWNYQRRMEGGHLRPTQAVGNVSACLTCEKSLAGKRADAKFCSAACGQLWNQRLRAPERAAKRLELNPRPPCRTCGKAIGVGQRAFCSAECRDADVRPRKYGLTVSSLEALLASQGGVCAICGTTDWGRKGPHIDHSHKTGAVRGVLCGDCNVAISRLHDEPARGRAAVAYLERHAVT